jgi:Mrp family chromosome partitioning ATPase
MRIVLVTGTVGVGKSTTGYAVAERAASQGRSAAFLDVDGLSRLWPARNRLSAPASTLEARLRQRHQGVEFDGLAWHLDRAPELVAIQDRGLQLPTVDASGSISETVDAVLALIT